MNSKAHPADSRTNKQIDERLNNRFVTDTKVTSSPLFTCTVTLHWPTSCSLQPDTTQTNTRSSTLHFRKGSVNSEQDDDLMNMQVDNKMKRRSLYWLLHFCTDHLIDQGRLVSVFIHAHINKTHTPTLYCRQTVYVEIKKLYNMLPSAFMTVLGGELE